MSDSLRIFYRKGYFEHAFVYNDTGIVKMIEYFKENITNTNT